MDSRNSEEELVLKRKRKSERLRNDINWIIWPTTPLPARPISDKTHIIYEVKVKYDP